jgi:hypothetical protein
MGTINPRQNSDGLDLMRERGHQDIIDWMQKDFSQEWILAWCRMARLSYGSLDKFINVARSRTFKKAAKEIDALILTNINQLKNAQIEIPEEFLILTLAKGGKLPSRKDRDTLKVRANIAKLIRKLATSLDGDEELQSLDVQVLHAVAVDPLGDELSRFPGAPVYPGCGFNRPQGDCKELRTFSGFNRGPMLQEILNGIAKRIEARKPFGILEVPLPGTPNQNRATEQKVQDDQRTLLERRLNKRFLYWFGKSDADLITDLVGLAFNRKVTKAERLLTRDRIGKIK